MIQIWFENRYCKFELSASLYHECSFVGKLVFKSHLKDSLKKKKKHQTSSLLHTYTLLPFLLPNVLDITSRFPICFSVIFAHASFRLRNMKNKLENRIECAGLKRSPMGILLEALGQQEENLLKIQTFLEGKLKEWLEYHGHILSLVKDSD